MDCSNVVLQPCTSTLTLGGDQGSVVLCEGEWHPRCKHRKEIRNDQDARFEDQAVGRKERFHTNNALRDRDDVGTGTRLRGR